MRLKGWPTCGRATSGIVEHGDLNFRTVGGQHGITRTLGKEGL